ncbi:MAG: hypothetical protein HC876_23730 [Chloroflexaceae bacterium]|nr:hypothetical protein [Chloroflexaceae bacterium]
MPVLRFWTNRNVGTTIFVQVLGAGGVPLANHPIRFENSVGRLSSQNAVTDANGRAQVEFTNPNIARGVAIISAVSDVLGIRASTTIALIVPPCNDIENDNDSILTPPLPPLLTTIDGVCTGSLADDPEGEDDYYRVPLQPGDTITVRMEPAPTDANYDLGLFRPLAIDPNLDAIAFSELPGNATEQVTYRVPADEGGDYFIRVYQTRRATTDLHTYDLTITIDR